MQALQTLGCAYMQAPQTPGAGVCADPPDAEWGAVCANLRGTVQTLQTDCSVGEWGFREEEVQKGEPRYWMRVSGCVSSRGPGRIAEYFAFPVIPRKVKTY